MSQPPRVLLLFYLFIYFLYQFHIIGFHRLQILLYASTSIEHKRINFIYAYIYRRRRIYFVSHNFYDQFHWK